MRASFIIPCYNSSSTVERCLDSIFGLGLQTSDFEVVVVDDHSCDSTVDVVKRYASTRENMVLLNLEEHHCQGAARNCGLSVAKGSFVIFVDSDDMVDKGMLTAVEMSHALDLDMAAMNFSVIDLEGVTQKKEKLNHEKEGVLSGVDFQTEFPFWASACWQFVYKRSFLSNVNYPFVEDAYYEDSDFVFAHLFYADRVSYCPDNCYFYIASRTSVTHTLTYKNVADYFMLGTRMLTLSTRFYNQKSNYALDLQKGGVHNISNSFKRMLKLSSVSEIKSAFYSIDEHFNIYSLMDSYPDIRWSFIVKCGIMHRSFAICCMRVVLAIRKVIR